MTSGNGELIADGSDNPGTVPGVRGAHRRIDLVVSRILLETLDCVCDDEPDSLGG